MARNIKVIEVNAATLGLAAGPAVRAGLRASAETRIAQATRDALRSSLRLAIELAWRDGGVKTGNARNIMRAGVRVFGSNLSNIRGHVIGPSYVKLLDEGGTVSPTRAQYLAVPLQAALRPDGSPKLPGPRSWKNILKTFIWKSQKTGKSYIVYKKPSDDTKFVFLYALVDEVDIQKRKGFLTRALNLTSPQVVEAFGAALLLEMGNVSLGKRAGLSAKYDRPRLSIGRRRR